MRTEHFTRAEIEAAQAETKKGVYATLENLAPWACKFLRVWDGYIAFESVTDYETARNQK